MPHVLADGSQLCLQLSCRARDGAGPNQGGLRAAAEAVADAARAAGLRVPLVAAVWGGEKDQR